MNIILFGHVCIDRNVTEHAEYTSWGSPAIYMATYLQGHLSENPVIISSYGPDLLPYLPKIQILPEHPNRDHTLRYENHMRSVPRIWKAYQTNEATVPELTPEIQQALNQADLLIVGPILPNFSAESLKELMSHLSPNALKVLCPQGYFRSIQQDGLVAKQEFNQADQIVPMFDLLVYSEEDHTQALELAKTWANMSSKTKFIVTNGPSGATVVDQSGANHIPTTPIPPEKIIDSVGCGDVFAVTAAYYYRISGDLRKAVAEAHKAAGRKLQSTPSTESN